MSFLDIFRSGPNPNAIQQNAAIHDPMNPNNHMQQQVNNKLPDTQQPGQPPVDPQAKGTEQVPPQSPEVDLSKLWINDPNNKGPADPAEFRFNVDAAKINETFGTLDFTKSLTPELLTKINGGGADAMSALLTAVNIVGQQAAKTAVMAATKVSESGFQQTGQRMKDYIPSVVRENQVQNALREDNPLMKNPAYAPMVEAVTLQLSRQFPQATAEQIKTHATRYFDNMVADLAQHGGKQLVDVKAIQQASGQSSSADFSAWEV